MMRQLLDWVPFAIFIGLIFFFVSKMKVSQAEQLKRAKEERDQRIEEMRKIHATLERIVAALEKRNLE